MSEMSEVTTETRATIAVSSQGESWGDIVLKFYPDVAPNHARNFCKLGCRKFLQWDHVSSSYPRIHDPGRRPEQQECRSFQSRDGRARVSHQGRVQQQTTQTWRALDGAGPGPRQRGITVFYLRRRCVVPGWSIHGLRRSHQRHGNRRSRRQRQT